MTTTTTTKKKTFVLLMSTYFMKDHPRAGELTGLEEKILSGEKIHTIRGNYDYWKEIVDKVNAGEAIISVRKWTGKPYRSKQEEITQLEEVGIQKIRIQGNVTSVSPRANSKALTEIVCPGIRVVANNDGLSKLDFLDWFEQPLEGAIIHFTDFRY